MSNSNTHTYRDHKFLDMNEAEFAAFYPKLENSSALFRLLKDSLPAGEGKLDLELRDTAVVFSFNDGNWQELKLEASEMDNSLKDKDISPMAELYKYEFKAISTYKAKDEKPFLYSAKLTNGNDLNGYEMDITPPDVSLAGLSTYLKNRFGVNNENLMKYLSYLDIGTFQLDISLAGDSYVISRLYQAQAVSGKPERKERIDQEHDRITKENVRLEKEKRALLKIPEYEMLKSNKDAYDSLREKLGLMNENDSKIEDISISSLRKNVSSNLESRTVTNMEKDVKILGFQPNDISLINDKLKAAINTYVLTKASHEELEVMEALEDITMLKDKVPTLYYDFISIVSDRILHFFSSPESRSKIPYSRAQRVLQRFNLEFFRIEPGSDATTKECRFVSVRESEFSRGACVETVSHGIRMLNPESVVYKADVIISL